MPFPRRIIVTLGSFALFGALFAASVAEARRANPVIEPADPSPAMVIYSNGRVTAGNTCTTGPYQISYPNQTNYLAPPEMIATLLMPGDCDNCTGGMDTLRAVAAHIKANFVRTCALPIRVSIIGAYDSAGCWLPDTNTVLCPPVVTTLSGTQGFASDNVTALPGDCQWTGPAYLLVAFLGTSAPCDSSTRYPRLQLSGSCTTCKGYDYFLEARIEMCSIEELNGRPAMWVDVASCAVPVTRRSWGQLKSIYRH